MHDTHFDEERILMPRDFESPVFAANNMELFDQYIEFRIDGHRPHQALRMTFGEDVAGDGQLIARAFCAERNPYVVKNLKKRMMERPVSVQWNPQVSVHELLQVVRDPLAKDSARIAAIKELNVMAGIVIDTDEGKTKLRRGLDDFYNEVEPAANTQQQVREAILEAKAEGDATRH